MEEKISQVSNYIDKDVEKNIIRKRDLSIYQRTRKYSDLSQSKWEKIDSNKYFLGKKCGLNKRLSFDNLLDIKEIMDSVGIVFWLTFGTLLGAVRDKDFISFDHDTDISASSLDLITNFDILKNRFILKHFIFRDESDDNGLKIRVYRNKQACCIEGFIDNSGDKEYLYSKNFRWPRKYFDNYGVIDFKGTTFRIPSPAKNYLSFIYKDWETPIKKEKICVPQTWRRKEAYREEE